MHGHECVMQWLQVRTLLVYVQDKQVSNIDDAAQCSARRRAAITALLAWSRMHGRCLPAWRGHTW